MKEDKDIEELFKDSFEDFEPPVKSKVWENIRTGLKWGGAGLFIKLIINQVGTSTVVAVASSVLTVLATVFVLDANKEKETSLGNDTIIKTQPVIAKHDTIYQIVEKIVEKPVPVESTRGLEASNNTDIDKQKIKSLINTYKDEQIASIYASPISGPVPLIVDLKNLGTGSYPKWLFSDGKKSSTKDNPVHIFEKPGVYTIKLNSITKDGRVANDEVTITVTGNSSMEQKPRVISFTPNGDGKADVFSFKSMNMTEMKGAIYDNKSRLIYEWEGNDGVWDGMNKYGYKVKADTYFYIISAEGVDGKKYDRKGVIKLER